MTAIKLDSNQVWLSLLEEVREKSDSQTPLYMQIFSRIKKAIDKGEIEERTKLPTNRQLAVLVDVDRSTAARAYSELSKAGYIESYVGRGTYARKPSIEQLTNQGEPVTWSQRFSKASQTVFDIFRAESSNYEWKPGLISFAGGIPTFDNYPTSDFESILKRILEEKRSNDLFEYSPAEGHPALRKQVLKHLADSGNHANEEELLIVSGSQQGIDIVSSVLLDPGDRVALEDPTYLWATCSFKSRQAECLPVPIDQEGIKLDILESHLKRYRPKLIYVIPNFQNPTGITMSLKRRIELIKLAHKYQTPILEDDFVGDLRYEGERIPSLRALEGGDQIVIHQGTFSKALCPALRLGWIVAPREVLNRLILAKRASNLSTNSISQIILAEFLERGLLDEHLRSVRAIYRKRRDIMLERLNQELSGLRDKAGNAINISWSEPDGGMFIWVRLPEGYSTKELLRHAQQYNVSFAPGHLCFVSPHNTQYLRLCFIQNDEETIQSGIERLTLAIRSYIDEISERKLVSSTNAFTGGGHTFI